MEEVLKIKQLNSSYANSFTVQASCVREREKQ